MNLIKYLRCLLLLSLLSSSTAYAWFDCNWYHRSDVLITENAGNNLANYQVLLKLNSSSLHPSYNWSSAGQDLRVLDSNDSSQLDFFIQSWDAASKLAEVWVKVPALPANGNKTIYIYYGNPVATSESTATVTLTEPGIKFHTRQSTANPNNKTSAFNFFNNASDGVPGYGCKFISNFTAIRNGNQFTPSTNMNFGAYSETFFEVKANEVGVWSIRYGADFGRGGGLFVDGIPLEEDWNNDLWWSSNWAHPDVLQGSINLTAGYHRLEVLGFEGCCDGGITVQFKKPGSAYQTYSTANISVRSRKCPTIEPSTSITAKAYTPPQIKIKKISEVISDPVNLLVNPKRIAGSRVRYTITVSNSGSPVDLDSIHIKDPVPTNTRLLLPAGIFSFQDGSPSSGLNFVYAGSTHAGDDVAFSSVSNAADFSFQPVMDANQSNANISHVQLSPKGRFGCSSTPQPTSFELKYDVIIE